MQGLKTSLTWQELLHELILDQSLGAGNVLYLYSLAAAAHMWLPSSGDVASATEELNFKFYVIF